MKKKLIYVFNIILLIFVNCNIVFADDLYNKIYGNADGSRFFSAASLVAGYITYFAIAVCVIMLMYLGIKFITSAPEGKAEVKKHLIYVTIGLFILFFMTAIFNWIKDLTSDINNIPGPPE